MSLDQIRNKLSSLSKQELLQFIQRKGDARKKALREAAVFQTQDWHNTQSTQENLEQQLASMKTAHTQYHKDIDMKRAEAAKERDEVTQMSQDILVKEQALAKER